MEKYSGHHGYNTPQGQFTNKPPYVPPYESLLHRNDRKQNGITVYSLYEAGVHLPSIRRMVFLDDDCLDSFE